ncbi:5642_t:CDS:1, partial [Cetraspora pellucida]
AIFFITILAIPMENLDALSQQFKQVESRQTSFCPDSCNCTGAGSCTLSGCSTTVPQTCAGCVVFRGG